ncbi:60S ribosomal protein L14A [Ranunculus cassubicifolius]
MSLGMPLLHILVDLNNEFLMKLKTRGLEEEIQKMNPKSQSRTTAMAVAIIIKKTLEIQRLLVHRNKITFMFELVAGKLLAERNKWENSSWGRKLIVQKRRAALTAFDRFKLMLAKIKRGGAIRQELAKLKKQAA